MAGTTNRTNTKTRRGSKHNIIGESYVLTVNPVLQEKAKQAGYELIYQGDPNDTTGRTVVAKDRQLIDEDLGFGLDGDGFNIRGIFKYWVPDPNDPNQQKQIYAVLENPITNEEYTIAVKLFPDTGGDERTTWFAVDDLNIGINEVNRRAQEQGGYKDGTFLLPDTDAPAGTPHKKVTDFPTLNDLVRKQGLDITELIAPGDYVAAILQTAGTTVDPNGVRKVLLLTVRRFGGIAEWEKEVGAK